jgi:hypothetical protein
VGRYRLLDLSGGNPQTEYGRLTARPSSASGHRPPGYARRAVNAVTFGVADDRVIVTDTAPRRTSSTTHWGRPRLRAADRAKRFPSAEASV